MSNTSDYLKYAETAFAAYASNLIPGSGENADAYVSADMAPSQAQRFDATWQVLGQQDLSDGFSAVLFQQVDASGQPVGQKVLAIRGSEASHWGIDYLVDAVGVAILGTATGLLQYESLQDFYLSLIEQGKLGATEGIVVAGHSLGGFLAQAFTAKHFVVSAAYTYNSPGFSVAPGVVANLGTELLKLFGLSGTVPNDKIVNIRALDGISGTAGLGQMIGSIQAVNIEAGNPIHNHSIVTLTDALSISDLFAKIDPTLNTTDPAMGIDKVSGIFKAASNQDSNSLESALDQVRQLFLGKPAVNATPTRVDDRDSFYTNLYALQSSTAFQAWAGQVSVASLADKSADAIAALAQSDMSYRYALTEFNPFAITGAPGLYDPFNANGELNLYDSNTGTGTLTTRWLEDRAKFLTTKIGINTNDQLFAVDSAASTNTWYQDLGSRENAYVLNLTGLGRRDAASIEASLKKTEAKRVFFGTDAAEPDLTGGANADALYGNGGDDRLSGLGGADYLQGDAGWDRLYGGEGNDELVGGKDKDLLLGGAGIDTYTWNTGDGADTIVDSDGQGKIMFAGVDLTGAYERKGDNDKTFGNADFTLTWNGKLTAAGSPEGTAWLTIAKDTDPSGTIRILGFDSATTFLGIDINGVPSTQVYTDLSGTNANDTLGADASFQKVYGLDGNDRITVSTAGAVAYGGTGIDYITNGAGDQKLYGDAGNDILVASDGNDELYGGIDNDALQGGADDDYLEGNEGNDVLDGGAGGDVLAGGDGSDVLLGGGSIVPGFLPAWDSNAIPDFGVLVANGVAGLTSMAGYLNIEGDAADVLDGGAGNDTLFAGDGDDLLKGGSEDDLLDGQAGNDTLEGGDGADFLYGDGTQGDISVGGQDPYTLPQFHGDDYIDGGAGNDTLSGDGGSDALYGGGDNDIMLGDASGLAEQYHGADYLDGGAGNDQLYGYGKDDTLIGGMGDDVLEGDSNTVAYDKHGNDYLDGGDGIDVLKGDAGSDTLFGGEGNDQLFGDGDDIPVEFQGADYLDGEAGDDYLRGYGGNDTLFGGDGADRLLGEAGNDYLDGEAGDDLLSGGEGNDELFGGDGADDLQGDAGDDYLEGEDGNDLLSGGSGSDRLSGGAGNDQLAGDDGDDVLDGGADDDTFFGDAGNDTLNGGDGIDALIGGSGNDQVSGGAGDDQLLGDDGDDVMDGGVGDDLLFGDAGSDTLGGAAGLDELQGGDGNDTASGGEGDDLIAGGTGDDLLAGDEGNDELQGNAGDDRLDGGAGDDSLWGNEGNDILIGGGGDNYFEGGAGNDILYAGTRSDVFYWQPGDGVDRIYDTTSSATFVKALQFGPGVTLYNIKLRLGSLMLDLGNGEGIHLENFDPENVAAGAGIDQFVFADGTVLGAEELIARGFDLEGTEGNDTLRGTSVDDRITGGAGNDTLLGGLGNDTLLGGLGNDTYVYNRGDGADSIVDAWIWTMPDGEQFGNTNTLSLGAGITPDAIAVRLDDATRHVMLDFGGGDSVDIGVVDNIAIQTLQFADGASQGIQEFLSATQFDFTGTAAAETLSGTTFNDRIEGKGGNDVLSGGAGSDVYIYKLGDGADTIYDNGRYFGFPGADGNTLEFGAGITPDMIQVRHDGDACLFDLGGGDSIVVGANSFSDEVLHGFDLNLNPFTTFAIQTVEFDDGTALGIQEFVTQRGLAKAGTAGADTLAGDDLYHGWIPDRLEGDAGNDTLKGGAGSDLYVFKRGDGADTIVDSAQGMVWDPTWGEWLANGPNTLVFGAGIAATDIVTRLDNASNHLVLDLGNGDRVDIGQQYYLAVQSVLFTDGTQLGIDNLVALRPVEVTGTAGADYLSGSRFRNRIEGFAGDDTLLGGENADVLEGGIGEDFLAGGAGSDTYRYKLGDGMDTVSDTSALQAWDATGQPVWLAQPNTLAFGPGITADMITPLWDGDTLTLDLGNGDSIGVGHLADVAIQALQFDDGTSVSMQDFLVQKGTIQRDGTDGADLMASFGNGATLQGLGGDDWLYGSVRDDVLEGGAGNDLLLGSAGSDTYIYNLGDGADVIVNYGGYWPDDVNTLSFGAGITPDMIAPRYDGGALTLDIGNGDSIAIGSIDELAIQKLQFADGGQLTVDQLIALQGGFLQIGTPDSDVLYGTQFDDRLEGLEGGDTLYGDEGNDTLAGGPGNDSLAGGAGDDTYLYNRGDGADVIDDLPFHWGGPGGEFHIAEVNTLKLGAGITPAMVTPILDQNEVMTLDLGGGDSVRIGWQSEPAVQIIAFSDGAAFSIEDVWSGKPAASPIADQVTRQGDNFSFSGAANAFFDFDGDSLSYAATLGNGSALPTWLDFDGATGTFSGVPGNSDVASLDLKVTATDPSGFPVASGFKLDVLNVNDAPTVVGVVPNQIAVQGQVFSFSLSPDDVETGGSGGFLVDPADTGTAYGGELSYDSYQSRGTGDDTYEFGRGSGNIYVSDWDSTPGNVDTVQFGPDVLPADVSLGSARRGGLTLSIEDSGETLTLGAWLFHDAAKIEEFVFADGTVWGVDDIMSMISNTPTIGGDYIVGTAGNDGINALAGEDISFGGAGDDTLLGGAGNDGLYGEGGSDVLVGGSGADDLIADGSYSDSASDLLAGGAGDDNLRGSISNDLLIGGAGNDNVSGNDGNDVVLFNRGDGNDYYESDWSENNVPLEQRTDTVSLGGGIAYADLAFERNEDDLILHVGNDESITFLSWFYSGGQDNKAIGRLQVVAEAMAGYDPYATDPLLDQRVEQFGFVGLANRFEAELAADPGIATWQLAPHLADFALGGSATDALGGDLAYLHGKEGKLDRLTETGARAELTDARFGVAAQTLTKVPAAVAAGVFDDIDFIHGDYLTLSAATADGSALPAWLSFDAETGTFSGTPAYGDIGDLGVKVTATDAAGASASQTFSVVVAKFNNAPVVSALIGDQTAAQDSAFSFTVPANSFTDIDMGDTLSYSATLSNGDPLPAWLNLDGAIGRFSGVPGNLDVASLALEVTATDPSGLSASSGFKLDVLNVNDAPTVVTPLPDQSVTEGQAFSIALHGGGAPDGFLNDATDIGTADQVWPNYNEYIEGGAGNDTYSFARGGGNIYFFDWDPTAGNVDTIRLADVLPGDVTTAQNQWGDVIVSINGTSDGLTLASWFYSDANKIEQLVFEDGTVWGVSDIQSRFSAAPTTGSDYITGTDENDTVRALSGDDGLSGAAGNDTLLGGAGNDGVYGGGGSDILFGGSGADYLNADENYSDSASDLLSGGAGNDYLDGSISNDLLIGGAGDDEVSGNDGNDVVLFNRGDGYDYYATDWSENGVPLAQRTDTVSLGGGIAYADLAFGRAGNDLILQVGNDESIAFWEWFNTEWQDNKAISTLQLVAEAMVGFSSQSTDPLLNKRIQQFDFVGLANQFEADRAADPDIFAWQLAPLLADFSLGGSDTAAIGGDMAYLYGKNGNLDALTEAEVREQLNAATFGTASQALTKATTTAGTGVFDDVDFIHGDTLTYSATLADGSALPAWLIFDAVSGAFSGTPDRSAVGNLNVSVIATDAAGLTAATSFVLSVNGVAGSNVAPTLDHPLPDQATNEDNAFTFTIPTDTFSDADLVSGDTLTYSATLADGNPLPEWLLFDEATGTFSGAPDNWDVGSVSLTATATDTAGLTASSTFELDVLNVNDAPIVANALADLSATEDQSFNFAIPAGTFNDDDFMHGDSLSYSATLADGSALPSWLSFDAATGAFGGMPLNADVGSLNLAVSAADTGGLTVSSLFGLSVANVNDSPTAADDAGVAQEDGGALNLSAASLLSNDTDPDAEDTLDIVGVSQADSGATVSLVPSASPGHARDVQYDVGNLYQSLGAGQTATDAFRYTIADAEGATSTADVVMTISGVNDAPVTAADVGAVLEDDGLTATGNVLTNDSDVDAGTVLAVADAGARQGNFGSLALVADGSYTYTLENAATVVQALAQGQQATDTFAYAASDGMVNTAGTLTLTITGTNDAPLAHNDTGAARENGGTVTLAAAVLLDNDTDADVGDTRAITAVTGSAAGATVSLVDGNAIYDPGTLFQSLKAGATTNDSFSYTMADGQGVTSTATVAMTVTGANDAPVVANAIADQGAAAGSPFSFSVAANTFFDIDAGDALVYSATLADGTPLPAWLTFDAATRTFTGTPPGGADCGSGTASSLQLRIDTTDMAGASAFDEFALNISGGGGSGSETIIGTDHDDVLVGTSCDDIIDGRKGFDKMSGGKGDDVYYVDETCSSGGRHGNEGVGNGEDAPPPGHDHNHNDGPGTSPGDPGSRHGGKNHADGGHDDDHDGSGHGGNGHGGGKHDDDDDDDDDDDHGGPDHGIQCRVDEVIENADAGYDSVYSSADYTLTANVEELHLIGGDNLSGHGNALDNIVVGNSGDNALYGEAGDDLLMDDAGDDSLYGGAGKDVLDGGAGDDKLLGEAGDDIYVHSLGGGDDVVQESGGQDTIRFGEGIAASAVSVLRSRDDLVLKLSSRNGSVTVKNWFSGSASRVERVQFADGSAWTEAQVRERVGRGSGGGASEVGPFEPGHDDGRSSRRDNGGSGHDADRNDGDRNDGDRHDGGRHDDSAKYGDARDAIAARLEKSPNYDFTSLSAYLAQHQGGGYGALTAAQVAAQWRSVQERVAQLAQDDEDARRGAHGGEHYGGDDGFARGAMFWGHDGSTGQNRAYGGMATFGGLDEGFRKLG